MAILLAKKHQKRGIFCDIMFLGHIYMNVKRKKRFEKEKKIILYLYSQSIFIKGLFSSHAATRPPAVKFPL